MIIRRHFVRRVLGGIAAGVLAPVVLLAETKKRHPTTAPAPSPTPEDAPTEKEETARLRVWKVSDAPDVEVQFRLLPYGKSAQEALSPLKIEAGSYEFSDYVEVPAGPVTVEVEAPDRPIVHLPSYLAAGEQSTVLVRVKGATLSAEWIDDTPRGTDSLHEFAVYNLLPSSGDIRIDLGTLLSVHLTTVRGTAHLSGIKRAVYPVTVEGTDDKGKNFHWTTDVDFRQGRKAALLIYPDAYGRIRPRISVV